jgi:transcriptional regulator with XRE-family HTH domain
MLASTEIERKAPIGTMGRRIASRRALLGIESKELAATVGISRNWMSAIEKDKPAKIDTALLVKLAAALGVSETWILHGDPQSSAA